ncbi:NitT/TauT family transport system ATP-binding protein [Pacificibacter maritimus]|uniref:NitT/TauT family transport system ATP-binding protein n=1 Tax=Pacificibacter maritimus TaxID=762213 RepID=A0A3N4U6Y1_9RHOB|nr:CmpA/NrtA family ABC transporter substrate-binding protein [Pacificibacter maritimus]RPE66513.1 NitT/TauT family transport system ATP-binding protein [Pacificibacter maritimus]
MTQLSVGYVPLLDAAPLIIAQELGFAAEEGLDLDLRAAPSWSSVRDMLNFGAVDAAHMLSPVPIAASLGLGGHAVPMSAVSVLSANGTVIGVTNALAEKMRGAGYTFDFNDAAVAGRALIAASATPLRIGVPFPFSMHSELLIYWLNALGLPAPQNVDIKTVPPSLMGKAMRMGEIDAFCVGEPWGSLAVEQGLGTLLLAGASIWSFSPEKVLAMRSDWAEVNPALRNQLIRAVVRAGRWLSEPASLTVASEILARPSYLNVPADILDRGLTGQFVISPQGERRSQSSFVIFHGGATQYPWTSQAEWIALQLARRTGLDREQSQSAASSVFRGDLFRDALAGSGMDVPLEARKVEGGFAAPQDVDSGFGRLSLLPNQFFDRRIFNPNTSE